MRIKLLLAGHAGEGYIYDFSVVEKIKRQCKYNNERKHRSA